MPILEQVPSGTLMEGKRGLIMGVANDHSIAWGVAKACAAQGAELAFTYQGEAFGKRVRPLAESVGSSLVLPADVTDSASLDDTCNALMEAWGSVDFVVHAVAFSDRSELKGRYVNTSRENFLDTMDISCFSFTDMARRAHQIMPQGGSLLTMSYLGAEKVLPNYNVMGVAKAALEASVRYLAADLGEDGIRVNALSPGPMRTLAGSGVGSARKVFRYNADNAPLQRNVTLAEVGGAALFLLSELGTGITGEVIHVDSGYHIMGMPKADNLP